MELKLEQIKLNREIDWLDKRKIFYAQVTGYNTVPEQTDSSPCIAASGDNICGNSSVIACPSIYPFRTKVVISNRLYICLDRTNSKFDGRFDISFDKNIRRAKEWGLKYIPVIVLPNSN